MVSRGHKRGYMEGAVGRREMREMMLLYYTLKVTAENSDVSIPSSLAFIFI